MMKLTDAIRHAEEIAEKCDLISEASKTIKANRSYRKCAEEHRQLADWLRELQRYQWIPCSERLPANDDWVIISVLDEVGDTPYRYSDFGWYLEAAKCWIVESEQRTDVVAWMPLPEPWKGETDGEDIQSEVE